MLNIIPRRCINPLTFCKRNIHLSRQTHFTHIQVVSTHNNEDTKKNKFDWWKTIGSLAILTSVTAFDYKKQTFNEMKPLGSSQELDFITLGTTDQFVEGELYNIKILGGKDSLLLVKIDNEYYCCGNSCSHYGAPLHRGSLGPGTVSCAFHAAEFDIKTGKAINGPVNQGLPKFETKVEDGKVYALVPKTLPLSEQPKFVQKDDKDKRVFVIIGSGPAGLTAAETLRSEGYTGEILMITSDPYLPYERPVLSKNMKAKVNDITIRSQEFIKDQIQMTVMNNTTAESIDPATHKIILSNGSTINYDKVLVATGGSARTLNVPGSNLKNIFCLRNATDNESIQPFAKQGSRVVVIGSSFIGMEVASGLTKMGAKVTIVGKNSTPFESSLGARIGNTFKNLFMQNGVEFFMNSEVKSFKGYNGSVNGVELSNGEIIQADAVIYGIGVVPNTKMIKSPSKESDGAIVTDAFLKGKGTPDTFFAGDIVKFPYYKTGKLIRVEHWNNASQHGRIAAKNMLGSYIPYTEVPFFWTMMFGKSLRFTGHFESYDEIVYEGDVDKMKFVAYYAKDKKVVAVATMGMDPFATIAKDALKYNLMPTVSELQLGLANSKSIKQNVKEFSTKVKITKVKTNN